MLIYVSLEEVGMNQAGGTAERLGGMLGGKEKGSGA